MHKTLDVIVDELYNDKPNENGIRLQKKTTLISKEGEIFTLTVERGDKLNQLNDFDSELFEKLAAIEHERWADWQKYVHSKCLPSADDGIWNIGERK